MKYHHNINSAVAELQNTHPPGKLITARIGLRTNGDIHLGNILPILTAYQLGKKLVSTEYQFQLLVFLVDQEIDGNKLPFNVRKRTSGEPLANHSINIIKNFINGLFDNERKITVTYQLVSEIVNDPKCFELLQTIIKKDQSLMAYALCPTDQTLIKKYHESGTNINFICSTCHKHYPFSTNNTQLKVMLDHDVLGVIENNLFPIDIHILGRDHLISEQKRESSLSRRTKLQRYLESPSHITLLTPLITDDDNSKMSKSKRHGIFLTDLKEKYRGDLYNALLAFYNKHEGIKKIQIKKIGLEPF